MKKIALRMLAVAALLAPTFAHADAEKVYGQWRKTFTNNGFTFVLVFDFSQDSVTLENTCKYKGQVLKVAVTASTEITDTEIIILEAASAETSSPNGLNCNVNIERGSSKYVVKGATLTLTAEGEAGKLVLNRVK
jgi:hypothetical protein